MVKIHRIWFNTERMDREDHYKITLFSRPRVSIHVDEYIWSFIEENIVKPHKLMRSEKHGYLLDISFDQFDPAKHRYYPLSPYNGPLREGVEMLRHRWRTNNAGKPIYGYECKRHHDTPRIRLQNEQGNPTPICEIKPVGQSKLELMASQIFERVWGDQREIVLQTCKMLDACYKPDADRRADLMKAKDDSVQLLQQQLDDLVVVRARGEIEQDKFLQRTIEIQQQMEALRQSKAQIASEDYNPGRLDMEAIEAALCEAVEMHDGLVSEDFIDLFVSQVTPLSDSRFAWCLDFSPQPTVAFLNLAGQRKYTNCSMDSKLHFGPFADEEGHTIPFPGSLRR